MTNKNIGKAAYGVVGSGVFSANIVSGIITGVSYTEDKPLYELSFGKNKYTTKDIAHTKEELFELLHIGTLERVSETHGLKIKYKI